MILSCHTKPNKFGQVGAIELQVLMGQCLNRRFESIAIMEQEVKAWPQNRNNKESKIDWQFTNDKARIKLKRLYSTILD